MKLQSLKLICCSLCFSISSEIRGEKKFTFYCFEMPIVLYGWLTCPSFLFNNNHFRIFDKCNDTMHIIFHLDMFAKPLFAYQLAKAMNKFVRTV